MSQTVSPDLDASTVALSDWPQMNAPVVEGVREGGFQTIIRRKVLDQIHAHGQKNTEVEICGVLVGSVFRDEIGPYLYISHMIKGDAAASHSTQVTFTAETWAHIQDVMDREHPGEKIVGWYHTHPGFGIFLSGMDLFIQDNFFNMPWQVAFVYDPIGEKEGLFVWRKGKSNKEAYLLEEDAAVLAAARKPLPKLETIGQGGPITQHKPGLYLTAFVIVFMAMYVFLVQMPPTIHYAPVVPSPGLQDPSAQDPPEMLDQPQVDPADDATIQPLAPPAPEAAPSKPVGANPGAK